MRIGVGARARHQADVGEEVDRDRLRPLAAYAGELLAWPWFEGLFAPAEQLYMARLLVGVYSAFQYGRLLSQQDALERLSAVNRRTAQRYLALAEKHGLIRLVKSTRDRRASRLVPTKKMLELVEKELGLLDRHAQDLRRMLETPYRPGKRILAPRTHFQRRSVAAGNETYVYNEPQDIKLRERIFADLEETLRLAPESFDAYLYRARLLFDAGEYEQARKDYEAAMELQPDRRETRFGYALVLEALHGKTKSAELRGNALVAFEKAISAGWDDAETYFRMGRLLAANHDNDRAIDAFTTALHKLTGSGPEKSFGTAMILRARGGVYESIDQLANALTDYEGVMSRRAFPILDGDLGLAIRVEVMRSTLGKSRKS